MTEYVYRVVSEWDINEGGVVFKTEDDAMIWLGDNPYLREIIESKDEEPTTVESIMDEGYISIEKLKFISYGA